MYRQLVASVYLLLCLRPNSGKFVKTGSEARSELKINGVAAGPFDPSKMSNWQYDVRYPMIAPKAGGSCPHNIYNGNAVQNGDGGAWNIYFGGWDGVSSCKDSVSVTVTLDKFSSFNTHTSQIATGSMLHVNNPSAIKVNNSMWAMVYTQLLNSNVNKPGISTSTNGVNWSPAAGGYSEAFVTMDGFSAWSNADVNGGNVIHYDEAKDQLHLYFVDFKQLGTHSVFHAIAPGISNKFTYAGIALSEPQRVVNDLKYINGWYVMSMHLNSDRVFYSVSSNLDSFPASKVLFNHLGDNDHYITSCGLVVDGDTLLGAVYGAGSVATLDRNQVFGVWLQRRVMFAGTDGTRWGIGDANRAFGADATLMATNKQVLSGKFYVYDTDYVDTANPGTLLEESPIVKVTQGDVWQWTPESQERFV